MGNEYGKSTTEKHTTPLFLLDPLRLTRKGNRQEENNDPGHQQYANDVKQYGNDPRHRLLLHAKSRLPEKGDQDDKAHFKQIAALANLFLNVIAALDITTNQNCNFHPLFDAVYENQEQTRAWLATKTTNQAETTQQPTTPEKTTTSFATMTPEQRSNWIENLRAEPPPMAEVQAAFQFLLENDALPKNYRSRDGKIAERLRQQQDLAINNLNTLRKSCLDRTIYRFENLEKYPQQQNSRRSSSLNFLLRSANDGYSRFIELFVYFKLTSMVVPAHQLAENNIEQKINKLAENFPIPPNFGRIIRSEIRDYPDNDQKKRVVALLKEFSITKPTSQANAQRLREIVISVVDMVENLGNREMVEYLNQVKVQTWVDDGEGGQDSALSSAQQNWYVVADGAGGHEGGKEASNLMCQIAKQKLDNLGATPTAATVETTMHEALKKAHESVLGNSATTASIAKLAVDKDGALCMVMAKVGDGQDFIINDNGTLVPATTVFDTVYLYHIEGYLTTAQYNQLQQDRANHQDKMQMSELGKAVWDNSFYDTQPDLPKFHEMVAVGGNKKQDGSRLPLKYYEVKTIPIEEDYLGIISLTDGVTDPLTFNAIQDMVYSAINKGKMDELPAKLIAATRAENTHANAGVNYRSSRFNANKKDDIGIGLMLFPQ